MDQPWPGVQVIKHDISVYQPKLSLMQARSS